MCDYVYILGNKHMKGQAAPSNSSKCVSADLFLFHVLLITFLFRSNISMHLFTPLRVAQDSFCCFHSTLGLTNTSALITTSSSAFPCPSHFLFGDEFQRRCHIHKIVTFRAWSPEDSYLGCFLDYRSLHSVM